MKKMKMVKLIALALVVVMMGVVFVACGNSGNTAAESSAPASDAASEAPASDAAAEAPSDDAAAADEPAASGDVAGKKVGYSCSQEFEERWQREIGMFEEFFASHDVEFSYQMAAHDNNKQVNQCENFINQGVDILILTPGDADAMAVTADACAEAGVTLIVYDQPLNSKNVDYLVTFDSITTGEIIASAVFEKAPTGNYIVLYGDQANMNAQGIKVGYWNIIGEAVEKGDITVVMEQWCENWDPNVAMNYVENGLTANNNDIQGILTPNDGTAGGAIQALQGQNLAGTIPVAGQDADLAACQRIVEGTQAATAFKNLITLNQATCNVALAVLKGEDPLQTADTSLGTWTDYETKNGDIVPLFSIPQVSVNKDNMYDEIISIGFHPLEEVYKNVPESEWPAAE
ncbi:MAG: substrate-binding domain-containing protein [Christensenellaceae bacterium]|jgi:D-xylose transport system substrate-binding protein